MPTISNAKKEKIAEQILHYLFSVTPQAVFTSEIAKNVARDEEFTKAILLDLKSKSFVAEVNKNSLGLSYSRRQRWRLTNKVYDAYKNHQF